MTLNSAAHANRSWWDKDAKNYHAEHPEYLSSFYWSPEMLHEADVALLGETTDAHILEIGCGSAPCTQWLQKRAAFATGFDISLGMLQLAGEKLPLVQADAHAFPYRCNSFDIIFSAFGALPFVPDLLPVFLEVARCLRTSSKNPGKFIFSVAHPMRWIFADDPETLEVRYSYFEKEYVESSGKELTYAEFQHQIGDYIRALNAAGFELQNLIEPTWPADLTTTWGQWSPKRGAYIPGTAIFSALLRPN
ncbi:class I SAM-dependent DNA methyltransferase [Corynebacterium caspium]|uniref:class I SAM-dependent DNA methyltransferase n=1 Tax=Corynebacterium caspium TaxID=234828 RepID=UPI000366577A|nr:class I SAM-dependent methyltransferase [Corynebacterium caspium]WKD59385.1 ubiquinone/menaquinone biosynthesis methyltransferase [Corynebacterium caspium DSM 44850]